MHTLAGLDAPGLAPFVRPIVDAPADAAPRLVLADWLDEHGDPERAAAIRLEYPPPARGRAAVSRERRRLAELVAGAVPKSWDLYPVIWLQLRRPREGAARSFPHDVGRTWFVDSRRPVFAAAVRHGFIEAVGLPVRRFARHAAAIFAAHPVRWVAPTDLRPDDAYGVAGQYGPRHVWAIEDHRRGFYRLPIPIFSRLAGRVGTWFGERVVHYPRTEAGRADAFEDLSRALVAYGRELAGLPPIAPE
jgi:uncharacterized protein (TIGR02996 family)